MIEVTAAIDIGGIDTEINLVSRDGKCYTPKSVITNDYPNVEEFVRRCLDLILEIKNSTKEKLLIKGIGIAAPNGNYFKGTIEYPVNLVWKGVIPFVEILRHHVDVPVVLIKDANAAAIGEKRYGGARDMQNFIVITLGAGLGSGIFLNGKLLHGHNGFAGEMGHVSISDTGRSCRCGREACLESYVSVTGIKRTIFSLLGSSVVKSQFRNTTFNELSGEQITEAALNGDLLALEAFDYTGRLLGKALANVVHLLGLEAIFIGGGLARAGDLLFIPAKKYMDEALLPVFQGKVQLYQSALMENSGTILGAGALAWDVFGS